MPAQEYQENKNGTYLHIYNKGVENRNLFNDDQDNEVFLSFLEEYLTPPPDPEKLKKTFKVKGRVFQGVPHLPQNYNNRIELIAYGLNKDHFHLIINEMTKGSSEKLVRSLCTRYAIYYNKKYQRKGSLFQGPYKSVQIKNPSLVYLTRHLHRECNDYSSYKDYLGERVTSWVKPNAVFSYLDKMEGNHFKGTNGYKNFVGNYKPNEDEEVSKDFTLEEKAEYAEKRVLEPEDVNTVKTQRIEPTSAPKIKPFSFISTSLVIFLLLFGLGIRNVNTSVAQTKNAISSIPSPTPQVSGAEISVPVKTMVLIKIGDDSESVNLRKEPTTQSEIVGKAKEGEVFELISEEDGWYQIKLGDGTSVFVSDQYAQIVEKEDNL